MSDAPIYADANRPAILAHGARALNFFTLRDAIIAYEIMPRDRQEIATITSAGRRFAPAEIRRLSMGPSMPADKAAMSETLKGEPDDVPPV
jgi:hypothetical protein